MLQSRHSPDEANREVTQLILRRGSNSCTSQSCGDITKVTLMRSTTTQSVDKKIACALCLVLTLEDKTVHEKSASACSFQRVEVKTCTTL